MTTSPCVGNEGLGFLADAAEKLTSPSPSKLKLTSPPKLVRRACSCPSSSILGARVSRLEHHGSHSLRTSTVAAHLGAAMFFATKTWTIGSKLGFGYQVLVFWCSDTKDHALTGKLKRSLSLAQIQLAKSITFAG